MRLQQWDSLKDILHQSSQVANETLYALMADAILCSEAPVKDVLGVFQVHFDCSCASLCNILTMPSLRPSSSLLSKENCRILKGFHGGYGAFFSFQLRLVSKLLRRYLTKRTYSPEMPPTSKHRGKTFMPLIHTRKSSGYRQLRSTVLSTSTWRRMMLAVIDGTIKH